MHLREFYEKYFPAEIFYRLLGSAAHRELVYTRAGYPPQRYRTAGHSPAAFRAELIASVPPRIDLGPEYNEALELKPLDLELEPVRSELRIDIDVTDYSDVRACSTENHVICKLCWRLVACAIESTDFILRNCFGFHHLMWLFSGRRGAHCWILDRKAYCMTDTQRRSITEFFHTLANCNTVFSTLSSCTELYTRILQQRFDEFVRDGVVDFSNKVLPLLSECVYPMAGRVGQLLYETDETSQQRWRRWKKFLVKEPEVMMRVAFRFIFPRLDYGVTRSIKHLLRAPFSVHQETGALCAPLLITPKLYQLDPVDDMVNIATGRNLDRLQECQDQFAVLTAPRAFWFDYWVCYYCFRAADDPFEKLASAPFLFGWQEDTWQEHVCNHHPAQPEERRKSTLGARYTKFTKHKDYPVKAGYYQRIEAQLGYLNFI